VASIKIAIYDLALHFIGGGQRYICQIAQTLSKYHEVDLISDKMIAKTKLESAYGINLDKVNLICLNNTINNLDSSDLRARIKQNYNKFKNRVFNLLKNERIQNIYAKIEPLILQLFLKITRMIFVLTLFQKKYSLYELIRDRFFDFLKIKVIKNLYDRIELLTLNSADRNKRMFISSLSKKYDIFINGEGGACWYINPQAKRNIMICHFPTPITNHKQSFVKHYEIYCNSTYTRKWIIRLWNVIPKGILYPPVNFFQNRLPKKNYILNSGRFIPIREQKKQLSLIKAFIILYNSGIKDYELHLIGGTSEYYSQIKYLKTLVKLAEVYPIYFHFNVDHSILGRYYQESKIFWNLVGLNVDEYKYPQDIEHFGMTTVESMQNYCVPIVYNKGGLKEIIAKDTINGFLVENITSLIEKTKFLIENESICKEMALNAFKRGKELSLENFKNHLLNIISGVS